MTGKNLQSLVLRAFCPRHSCTGDCFKVYKMELYKCSKCGESKPASEYHKDSRVSRGFRYNCRDCCNSYYKKHYKENTDMYRNRKTKPLTEEQIKKRRASNALWLSKNKHKKRTHGQVAHALKMGRMVKENCFVCGSGKVEAHHCDYSKPLEVIWLCRKHHLEIHRKV